MQNLYKELIELLEQDPALIIEEKLNKALIIDRALKLDAGLIKLLLSSTSIKKHFFQEIEGVQVFDKIAFQRFVNTKQFLPDSYTQFKNKIGLSTDNENYLTDSREVVLVWPHKDCVLEGGQTKEDTNRNEIFYNQTLAPDDIDRLTAPKVLTNWKRYDKDGEHPVSKISKQDNFIIKGNNLLALHTLKEIYRGQVKLIYIDPPYNTGNDSFGYNDNFNHSSWLVFMKNRLTVAKDLLATNGVIFIQCDDNEQAYLKVLMDEVFGNINFEACLTTIVKTEGRRYGNIAKTHEYILIYCKNKLTCEMFEMEVKDKEFSFNDEIGGYDLTDLRNQNAAAFNKSNRPNLRYPLYVDIDNPNKNSLCNAYLEPKSGRIEVWPITINGNESVWRWGKEKTAENLKTNLVARKGSDGVIRIFQKYRSKTTIDLFHN